MTTDGTPASTRTEEDEASNPPELRKGELKKLVVTALLSEDPDASANAMRELEDLGDDIPPRLRCIVSTLQHAQGEARLNYAAKTPTGLVLDTPAVPLQEWSRFGGDTDADEWRNMLVFGDNLGVLAALLRKKQRGELRNADGTDGIRVCYIDPPFATKREFSTSSGATAYKDKVDGAEFVEFLRKRLILIRELLAEDGTLWVHLDTKKVHYIKVVLDEVFGEGSFQSEVIWKRQSAKNGQTLRQPGRIHETILMYTKSSTWVWNKQYTPHGPTYIADFYKHDDGDGRGRYRSSDLANPETGGYHYEYKGYQPPAKGWRCPLETMERLDSEGALIFPAKESGRISRKRFLKDQNGVQLQDIWSDLSPVQRPRYPTEKPQALIERAITASSNEGDLVLDCFMGSGSTLRAAEHLGRRWVGVDCGKLALHTATRDLLTTTGPEDRAVQPFSVSHAGLYDPARLSELDMAAWVTFALELFGAEKKTTLRNGVEFQGRLGRGTLVHVVDPRPSGPPTQHAGRRILDESYLKSLVGAARPGARTKLVVVLPDTLGPGLSQTTYKYRQSDAAYVTEVRVLKVPPSVTSDFLALAQPNNAKAVNDLIDAHGFNVAMPPDVTVKFSTVKGEPVVELTKFLSNTIVRATSKDSREEPPADGRDDLAMVVVDYDHEPDRFDFEDFTYAEDLCKAGWKLTLEPEALASPTALWFIDRFGNEERRVVTPAEFGDLT